MKISRHNDLIYALWFCSLMSCVEEIDLITETEFESVLVVEAIITDENKQQEINLSRVSKLEADGPFPENDASISVFSSSGNQYNFEEVDNSGIYLSSTVFTALPNTDYYLKVQTNDGETYESSSMTLTQSTQIDDLFVERNFNENDEEGVSILLDSYNSSGNSKYYRYEYEETYKIIAPLYSPLELIIDNEIFPIPDEVLLLGEAAEYLTDLLPRTEQKQICFNTVSSNTIILADTNDFQEDRLDGFRVHFISRDNFIMAHRYSILVKQYVQSRKGYEYYKTLNDFSSSENIFSESQVGFLEGNISSKTKPDEKVIGFFEVSSVDTERVYFNYADLFSGEAIPVFVNCDDFIAPALWNIGPQYATLANSSPLQEAINQGFQYYDENLNDNEAAFPYRPYLLVLPECGDCTNLGTNVQPDFWIE